MDLCDSACWFFSKGKLDKGWQFLGLFSEAFLRMEKRHPSLVTLPYQILDEFSSLPDLNIGLNVAEKMLRYISEVFNLQLGETHPLSGICQLLRRFSDRGELLQPAMERICERSLEIFGQTNPHTLDFQEVHNFIIMSKGHFADAETRVRRLLGHYEPRLSINHEAILQFRNQLAHALWRQGKYALLEKTACLNLKNAGFSCNRPQLKDEFLFSLRYLHLALRAQGKDKLAELLLRGALRLSIYIHKEEHFITEILSDQLRELLLSQGNRDEADRVLRMGPGELCESYLAEDPWNEGRAKVWASREGEEVLKYYPYRHTMYCGCSLWTTEDLLGWKERDAM